MKIKNPIKRALAAVLTDAGYTWKSGSWYHANDEVTCVINLQTEHGRAYYINIAFWLNVLGTAEFPKENHCHIRQRAESHFSEKRIELSKLLYLETDISDADREAALREFAKDELVPFCLKCQDLDGLRAVFDQDGFRHAFIHKDARPILMSAGDASQ